MKITGIILAAGMGKRLKEYTAHTPKALVTVVGDKPLISYAIDHVRALGIERIIVVGGFCFEDLEKAVHDIDPSIEVVENTEFTKQNLLSFAAALPLISDDESIFVVNVDYVFMPHTLESMRRQMEGFAVYASFDPSANTEDCMTVKVKEGNEVVAMSKTLTDFDALYNGLWFVESARMKGVRDIVTQLLTDFDPMTTTVEHIFREEIAEGRRIVAKDIGPADWYEIDTPEELLVARNALA